MDKTILCFLLALLFSQTSWSEEPDVGLIKASDVSGVILNSTTPNPPIKSLQFDICDAAAEYGTVKLSKNNNRSVTCPWRLLKIGKLIIGAQSSPILILKKSKINNDIIFKDEMSESAFRIENK